MGPQWIKVSVCLPESMIRQCRATTLERVLVDRFRSQAREQIKELKASL